MPFCSRCGSNIHEKDLFCANCGAKQSTVTPGAVPPQTDPFQNLTPRTAAILCYIPVVGWVAAVVVLAARRFRSDFTLRFHAFQGLYLFAVWLFIDWGIHPLLDGLFGYHYRLDRALQALLLGVWIFMLIKTSQEEKYVLPVIGELAQRSAMEH